MVKNATKREDVSSKIRNKLIAAIAMLLISILLMVSSTYAWFTLSIAPEVKGIDSSVTGNGALEIALMPTSGVTGEIKKVATGSLSTEEKNTAWGNLVDLSPTSYGLNEVSLLPAKLTGTTLNIATYGEDGRVVNANGTTALASYSTSTFVTTDVAYGVRAIGEKNGESIKPYAYVIDFAVRTNAKKNYENDTPANLLLQTAGIQRIYNGTGEDGSTNAETKGGGSTMTLTKTNASSGNLRNLMDAIRITFVENYGSSTGTPQVLAEARLKTDGISKEDATATAKIYLYKGNALVETEANSDICSLAKNQAKQISAIVWLDGDAVKSSDVDINADNMDITGLLNLQFATDAKLYPAVDSTIK